MEESLIVANTIPYGYTWTLPSRLGDALTIAEKFYGPRNKEFTLLGIEFCESGPRIWYPKSKDKIIIQLSFDAMESEKLALYQLAHECIHLLSPSGEKNSLVLEEGLAVYHSWYFVNKCLGVDGKEITSEKNYLLAGLLVEKLLSLRPWFFRELRKHHHQLWDVSMTEISEFCPELPKEEAQILARKFDSFVISQGIPSDVKELRTFS